MPTYPKDLRYTKDHEWVRKNSDGTVTVGITDFAQKQLGDLVFIELPPVGREHESGEAFGTAESVKAVTEIFAPVGGKVEAVNDELQGEPELANTDPYGDGWLIKLRPANTKELDDLLTAAQYEEFVKEAD